MAPGRMMFGEAKELYQLILLYLLGWGKPYLHYTLNDTDTVVWTTKYVISGIDKNFANMQIISFFNPLNYDMIF